MVRVISINFNGIRSAQRKGFFEWAKTQDADIICAQELKAQAQDIRSEIFSINGYHAHFHFAEKKGYSGVGIYSKSKPMLVKTGLDNSAFNHEGRIIQAEFDNIIVLSTYFPSGTSGDTRQEAKYKFLDEVKYHLAQLHQNNKPVLICGDWNIAHQNIDLKNWKGNQKNSGCLPEERAWLSELYQSGWTDVFRSLYPDQESTGYTWWSNRGKAYENNVGWRIDLQVASCELAKLAISSHVYKEKKFSDHAPLIVDYQYNIDTSPFPLTKL